MRRNKQIRRPQPKPKLPPGESELRRRIRQRYDSNPFAFFDLAANTFYHELPTAAEQQAFIVEYPYIALETFGFLASGGDKHPSSSVTAAGACVFRRDVEFFLKLLPSPKDLSFGDWNRGQYFRPKGWPGDVMFVAPDLKDLKWPDAEVEKAKARGAWWKANKLELTDEELIWMVKH